MMPFLHSLSFSPIALCEEIDAGVSCLAAASVIAL